MGIPFVSDIYDIFNTERNYGLQLQNYRYQKELQREIFAREDSSLQRRVADAEAAGLNPQLALGSGAGTGQAISTTAPQHDTPNIDFLNDAINLEKGIKELELLNSEKTGRDSQNSLLKLQELIEKHNFEYYKNNGLPTNANGQYVQLLQGLSSIIKGIKGDSAGSTVNEVKNVVDGWIKNQEKRNDLPAENDLPFDDDYTFANSLQKAKSTPDRFINWIKGKVQEFKNYRKKRVEAYDKKKKNIFGN